MKRYSSLFLKARMEEMDEDGQYLVRALATNPALHVDDSMVICDGCGVLLMDTLTVGQRAMRDGGASADQAAALDKAYTGLPAYRRWEPWAQAGWGRMRGDAARINHLGRILRELESTGYVAVLSPALIAKWTGVHRDDVTRHAVSGLLDGAVLDTSDPTGLWRIPARHADPKQYCALANEGLDARDNVASLPA